MLSGEEDPIAIDIDVDCPECNKMENIRMKKSEVKDHEHQHGSLMSIKRTFLHLSNKPNPHTFIVKLNVEGIVYQAFTTVIVSKNERKKERRNIPFSSWFPK